MSEEDEKAFYRREYVGFVPASAKAQEFFEKTKIGTLVELKGSKPRNPDFHRLFFAMIRHCADNTEYTAKQFLLIVKIGVGHVEWIMTPGGDAVPMPRSISFAKMGEYEFREFYNQTLNYICEHVIPGLLPSDVDAVVREFG